MGSEDEGWILGGGWGWKKRRGVGEKERGEGEEGGELGKSGRSEGTGRGGD